MKSFTLVLLTIIALTACNETSEQSKQQAPAQKVAVEPEPAPVVETPKVEPRFNQESCKAKLLEFGKTNRESVVEISTKFGKIIVQLYRDTPLHRANFIMLAKEGFYDSTLFYRVSRGFVIQGGSSDLESTANYWEELGNYKLEPEFKPHHIHKRGALAMARPYDNNPQKMSAPMSFYIVQGQKFNIPTLKKYAEDNKINLAENQLEAYSTVGGAMHLDGEHTVFGEVISGMDVVDKIADVEVDGRENPLIDLQMKVRVLR